MAALAESTVPRTADDACSCPHFMADASLSACAPTSPATFRPCLRMYSRDSRPVAGAIMSAAAAPRAVPATNIQIELLQDACGSYCSRCMGLLLCLLTRCFGPQTTRLP